MPQALPPGVSTAYLAERSSIERLARRRPGHNPALRQPNYSAASEETWRRLMGELTELHDELASRAYLVARSRLPVNRRQIPNLPELGIALKRLTGFSISPVAGLVPAREFYGAWATQRFLCTQYIRPPAFESYSPEPDVVHDVVGHIVTLGEPRLARLYASAGMASNAVRSGDAFEVLSRILWFTIEVGVLLDGDCPRAYGGALLSSPAELRNLGHGPVLREWDLRAVAAASFDITEIQSQLFVVGSWAQLDEISDFLTNCGDRELLNLAS